VDIYIAFLGRPDSLHVGRHMWGRSLEKFNSMVADFKTWEAKPITAVTHSQRRLA